jgi:chitinase
MKVTQLLALSGLAFASLSAPLSAADAAAPGSTAPAATAAKPSSPTAAARFPVIGYFPSWTGIEPSLVQWQKLTHVFYSFINPTAAGGLTEVNSKLLGELVVQGRKHGVKVGVAIGGWNNGNTTDWESMAKRPKTRQKFVKNVVEFCDLHRLDAVDIDWEYPNAASSDDYAVMMKELGVALRKTGRLLSTAVVGKNEEFIAYIKPEVFASLDYLNIMAYDFNWGKAGQSHSSFGATDTALNLWLARGCPKEKVVLGVPFYGRNPEILYRELVLKDKQAHTKDTSGGFFYNGIPTIKKKTELALQKAGGVMIWEVTQDTYDSTSLLSAIHSTIEAYRGQAAK